MDRESNPAPVEQQVAAEPQPWALPGPEPRRREIRDRVVALAWPLTVRPLVAHGADRHADLPSEVERRIRPVAEHLAGAVVPLADQELFLRAFDLDWSTWAPRWEISAVWKLTPRSRRGARALRGRASGQSIGASSMCSPESCGAPSTARSLATSRSECRVAWSAIRSNCATARSGGPGTWQHGALHH